MLRRLSHDSAEGRPRTQEGERVSFLVSDVFLPAAEVLHENLSGTDELQGTVVGFSDSGSIRRAFAVVEVTYKHTLIVPVQKLKPVESSG